MSSYKWIIVLSVWSSVTQFSLTRPGFPFLFVTSFGLSISHSDCSFTIQSLICGSQVELTEWDFNSITLWQVGVAWWVSWWFCAFKENITWISLDNSWVVVDDFYDQRHLLWQIENLIFRGEKWNIHLLILPSFLVTVYEYYQDQYLN